MTQPVTGSPAEEVERSLAAIAAEDGMLRALVHVDAEGARRAARTPPDGPLAGRLVVLKDNADVAGMPTGCGADPRLAREAVADSAVAARLRSAGAILLGKANMLEFAYGAAHPSRGETRNPLDPRRSAGGSSGGSAAAVAAGFAWGAFGTDTGGSIRLPAAFCGVVGFKPTHGLVPLRGVVPLSPTLDHGGPLARTVADAARLHAAMAGTAPRAPGPAGRRLVLLEGFLDAPAVAPEVREAVLRALDRLEAAGFAVRRLPADRLPDPSTVVEALILVMAPEAAIALEGVATAHPDALTAGTLAQIAEGFAIPAVWHRRADQFRHHLRARLHAVLEEGDALVLPTAPTLAPPAMAEVGSSDDLAQMLCVAPFSLTGLPAISLPLPWAPGSCPAGLQLAGRHGGDAALLAVAAAVERALAAA